MSRINWQTRAGSFLMSETTQQGSVFVTGAVYQDFINMRWKSFISYANVVREENEEVKIEELGHFDSIFEAIDNCERKIKSLV